MPVYPRDLELGYLKNQLRTYALYFNASSVKEFIITTPWCTWVPVALYWIGAGSCSGFSPEISRCAACCLLSSTGHEHPSLVCSGGLPLHCDCTPRNPARSAVQFHGQQCLVTSPPLVDCRGPAAAFLVLSLLWDTQHHGLWAAGCFIVAGRSAAEGQQLSMPLQASWAAFCSAFTALLLVVCYAEPVCSWAASGRQCGWVPVGILHLPSCRQPLLLPYLLNLQACQLVLPP